MAGYRNEIIILEDDATLGTALKKAFEADGFKVYHSNRTDEVLELLEKNPIGVIFVDCLLPAESGVDFVGKIRKTYNASMLEVVLMSGVFTDPGFVKEATRTTQAKAFLKKPFQLSEALKLVEKSIVDSDETVEVHPRKELYGLFNKGKVSNREKKKAIEALEEIHGFDLPYIYSILVETKASGHLNVATNAGEVFGVSLSQGAIVAVDIPDKETYLGKLLIEKGFVNPEDLSTELRMSNQSGKKIGERLIQAHLMSPHALDVVMAHQMNIRLSRAIIDEMVRVNFVETEVEKTTPNIDSNSFNQFLHDWVASKISVDWLRAHFLQWTHCPIQSGPGFAADHPVLAMPLIANLENLMTHLTSGKSLGQLLDLQQYPEETFFKALHLLLTKGVVIFGAPIATKTSVDRVKFLKKVLMQFGDRSRADMYHIMAKMTGGGEANPDLVLREFKKLLGPEPAPVEKEIVALYKQLVLFAQQSYESIKAVGGNTMSEDKDRGDAVQKLKASSLMDEAKNFLQKSQYKPALEKIDKALVLDAHAEKARLYRTWGRLGLLDNGPKRAQILKELEMEMVQVPPEDKTDALYPFVSGLISKAKGDLVGAKKYFEKALAMDAQMIVARRELTMVATLTQKKDVFQADLRDIVGGFFKKK